jgi:hypothetical protein
LARQTIGRGSLPPNLGKTYSDPALVIMLSIRLHALNIIELNLFQTQSLRYVVLLIEINKM